MLSHVDENGQANMVDVSLKEVTLRDASAEAYIKMSKQAFEQVLLNQNKKGDVLGVARIAGIQGAKKCADFFAFAPIVRYRYQLYATHALQCHLHLAAVRIRRPYF